MKTLYFDCFSGISGDMTLGALLDLGADEAEIRRALASLPCAQEFILHVEKKRKHGFSGTQVTVQTRLIPHESEHRRGYTALAAQIDGSALTDTQKARAKSMLRRLGEAEAGVHGCDIEEVHFHEVGAVDTLVDLCGCVVALDLLNVKYCGCSPVNLGGGTVTFSHGTMGVPAPATALLLKGKPVYGDVGQRGELTTPTGAAIVGLCENFGPLPPMHIERQGIGFGQRDTGAANALRVILGETAEEDDVEPVVMLSCNLDDMSGEASAFAAEQLRMTGAIDVTIMPVAAKKSRSAIVLQALCHPENMQEVERAMFGYTTTLGVRRQTLMRRVLPRRMLSVATKYGNIRIKAALFEGDERFKPEYDDCASAARQYGVSLQKVVDAARQAYENPNNNCD